MIDEERISWIEARFRETQNAFTSQCDTDKYHALEMLEWTVQRVKAAVLADICIGSKAYPPNTYPWFSDNEAAK